MRIEDIDDQFFLVNGAVLQRHSYACEICTSRNEEEEPSQFLLEYDGQQLNVCGAHAQEILDLNDDQKQAEREDFFKTVFSV